MMNNSLIIILLILFTFSVFAQNKETISGFVYDKQTGEVLIGASVYEKNTKSGTVTNEYGFYSLTIPKNNEIDIEVSFIGYQPLNFKLSNKQEKQYNFYLTPGIILNEVKVLAKTKENIVTSDETGVVRLPIKEIKKLPNLFGEVDIIKAYQLTPGVQSGGEAKSSLYVRGGSPDQNLILLDDVPLYYVAHFGGFFSVFNADVINDVKLIKGGFPARYGSRLSSVLDVRMKEGNMQKFFVQGTVGLLTSKISIEGPVIKNKSSFIISARRNLLPVFQIMGAGLSYDFYDLNSKLNYKLSTKDRLFLSFYIGNDVVSIKENTEVTNHRNTVKWGNTLMALRWNHIYNEKLFGNLTFSNTYYRYRNIFEYEMETDSLQKYLYNSVLTGINDLSLKMDFTYLPVTKINVKFGINNIYHTFIPNDEIFNQSGTNVSSIHNTYSNKTYAYENAAYWENIFRFNRLTANLGIRYSSYFVNNIAYYSLEPRILLGFIFREDVSFKYSYAKMNQYVHLLTYSGVGIPSDYWMPTNENVKPENSVQNTIGIVKTFCNNRFELSVEAYYKLLDNLIAFKPGESFTGNLDSWDKIVENGGKGENYGIEFFLQKRTGQTNGWIGLTLAKAERVFSDLNNGKPYPFKYDRLVDVGFVVNHTIKKGIVLSATWTYGSGYPITLAVEHYMVNGEDIFVYSEKNSFRMRDYHRLDIAANFTKKTTWGERIWTISIFNLYNRKNPYYYYYEREWLGNTDNGNLIKPIYGQLKLYQKSLFGFLPSFAYSFKF